MMGRGVGSHKAVPSNFASQEDGHGKGGLGASVDQKRGSFYVKSLHSALREGRIRYFPN